LLLDRNTQSAEFVVQQIRQRQDGRNRSPWNEPECGLLYSRAMGGWNLLDQAAGAKYDSTSASLAFDPRYNQTAFKCFVVVEGGWGQFTQSGPASDLPSGVLTLKCQFGSM
jgi:hypothetical protein